MTLAVFTLVHILISLAGIASGLVVVGGWLAGKSYERWTAFFLAATVATSATGFFFPLRGFTPAVAVGILSLILLAVAIHALYVRKLWKSCATSTRASTGKRLTSPQKAKEAVLQ
jgi:hypothetical protein